MLGLFVTQRQKLELTHEKQQAERTGSRFKYQPQTDSQQAGPETAGAGFTEAFVTWAMPATQYVPATPDRPASLE